MSIPPSKIGIDPLPPSAGGTVVVSYIFDEDDEEPVILEVIWTLPDGSTESVYVTLSRSLWSDTIPVPANARSMSVQDTTLQSTDNATMVLP